MQRARVLSNLATAIYRHGRRDRYNDGCGFCEEAIALRMSRKFTAPSDMLLILSVEKCDWNSIRSEVERVRRQFAIGVNATRRAANLIRDVGRRREVLALLPRRLQ
jgi:hypothetical protein